ERVRAVLVGSDGATQAAEPNQPPQKESEREQAENGNDAEDLCQLSLARGLARHDRRADRRPCHGEKNDRQDNRTQNENNQPRTALVEVMQALCSGCEINPDIEHRPYKSEHSYKHLLVRSKRLRSSDKHGVNDDHHQKRQPPFRAIDPAAEAEEQMSHLKSLPYPTKAQSLGLGSSVVKKKSRRAGKAAKPRGNTQCRIIYGWRAQVARCAAFGRQRGPAPRLGAELGREQIVLPAYPARDQKGIDDPPEESDDKSDAGDRQDELGDRHPDPAQIEVVGAEPAQEEPQQIGDQRRLLVRLEQHERARVVRQTAALVDLMPKGRRQLAHGCCAPAFEGIMRRGGRWLNVESGIQSVARPVLRVVIFCQILLLRLVVGCSMSLTASITTASGRYCA